LTFEVKPKDGPLPIRFALLRQEGKVLAVFGNHSANDFLATSGADRIENHASFKRVSAGFLPKSGIHFFFDLQRASQYIKSLFDFVEKLDTSNAADLAEARKVLDLYDDFEAFAGSIATTPDIGMKSCVASKPGSVMDRIYNEFLNERKARQGVYQAHKVVDERTMFALSVSMDVLTISSKFFQEKYSDPSKIPGMDQEGAVEMQKVYGAFDAARQVIDTFRFKDVAAVVNKPLMGMIPTGGVYFGGSVLKDAELVNKAAETIRSVGGPAVPLKVGADPDGKPRIELAGSPGMIVYIALVKDDSLFMTMDLSLVDSLKAALSGERSYFDTTSLGRSGLQKFLENLDYFMYLNTDSILAMAKPYVPLLLAQQPDLKIEQAEIDELLTRLRTSLLISQRSYQTQTNGMCTESHWELLN
jgi:hypothetical protein